MEFLSTPLDYLSETLSNSLCRILPMLILVFRGDGVNENPYRLYNLDVFEYELDKVMSLYPVPSF